jgi:hypothetical protein
LISIMFASLVGVASSALISGTVRLIVHIVALVKIGTSLLPGTSLAMTSGVDADGTGVLLSLT